MIRKSLLIISLLLFQSAVRAQEVSNGGAFGFLNNTVDVRSAALGESGLALAGGQDAVFRNPAAIPYTLSESGSIDFGAGYSFRKAGKAFSGNFLTNSLGAYIGLSRNSALNFGFRQSRYGTFDVTDEDGNARSSYKPRDLAIHLGYSQRLTRFLSATGTVRYINSDIYTTKKISPARGVGFDAGLMFRVKKTRTHAVGFTGSVLLTNAGPRIEYNNVRYGLPATVKAGAAFEFQRYRQKLFTVVLDGDVGIGKDNSGDTGIGTGLEWYLFNFITLRGGYRYIDTGFDYMSFGTLGGTFRVLGIELNGAWYMAGRDNPYRGMFVAGLGYNF